MTSFSWKNSIHFFLVGAGLLALWLLVWPVKAQTACPVCSFPYPMIVKKLSSKYGESVRMAMIVRREQGAIVEVWTAADGGTWTIVIRNGACGKPIADGVAYQILEASPAVFIPGENA